jgi:hypothetical protein
MTIETKMDTNHDHSTDEHHHEPTDEPPEMVEEMEMIAEPHPNPEPKLESAPQQLPIVELRPATEAQIDAIDVRTEALMDLLQPSFEKTEDPLTEAILRILVEIRQVKEQQAHHSQMLSLLIQRQEFLASGQLPTKPPQQMQQ